jgi:type II secretory pathway pseudopilin PulG
MALGMGHLREPLLGGSGSGRSLLKRLVTMARARNEAGLSLVELLIAVAVMGLVTGIGGLTVRTLLPTLRADSALQQILIQLRQARTMSINQRRNFTVTFQGTKELVVVRQEVPPAGVPPPVPAVTTSISDTFLPGGMVYMVFAGIPDTPEGFGNVQALNFCPTSGACSISLVFQSDGSVLANGKVVNGTVFIGIPGNAKTARAVTVMGATGRMHGYRCNGAAWF